MCTWFLKLSTVGKLKQYLQTKLYQAFKCLVELQTGTITEIYNVHFLRLILDLPNSFYLF